MHTGHTRIKSHADNVEIVARIGDKLSLRDPAYRLDLIANTRRLFKCQILAGLFHPGNQLC